jgi:hypothetical protein
MISVRGFIATEFAGGSLFFAFRPSTESKKEIKLCDLCASAVKSINQKWTQRFCP